MDDMAPKWYFEDHVAGSVFQFGSIVVDEEEMLSFARKYDPQTFHADPDGARETAFGGVIASGWFTGSLAMSLIVKHRLSRVANFGSPGIDEVRWPRPVRPGDRLSVRLTIVEARRSLSKPDRGIVRLFIEVLNQSGDVVMTWKGTNIVRCRNSA